MKLFVSLFLMLLHCSLFAIQNSVKQDSLASSPNTQKLEEVIITDSKFPMKRSQSGKLIKKINREEIAGFQGYDLSDLLAAAAGIEVIGNGLYPGQNKTISLRGGRNRNVLILIDGVRVSDPSRIDNDFDINFLPLSGIESIEIMKGASSTLYGSAAATGVVNIKTMPFEDGFRGSVQSSVGSLGAQDQKRNSLNRFQNSITLQRGTKKWGFSLQASHFNANGMSAVIGKEDDPFLRYQWELKIKNETTEKFNWSMAFSQHNIESEYDNSFPISDASFELFTEMDRFHFNSDYQFDEGKLSLRTGYQKSRRNFKSDYPFETISENTSVDLFHTRNFNDKYFTVIGLQWQNNFAAFESSPNSHQTDLYANIVSRFTERFRINSGLRWNRHSTYKNHFTYSFNPSLTLTKKEQTEIKLLGAMSSAFIAPSLYQLFDSYSGNKDLLPEENQSFEIGSALSSSRVSGSLLYFGRLENSALLYDLVSYRYENGPDELWYEGIEVDFQASLAKNFDLHFQYTFVTTPTGDLRYLPKNATQTRLQYNLNDKSQIHLNFSTKGKRLALDSTTFLEDYQLLDIRFQKEIPRWRLNINASITNLLNSDYIQIEGYATRGRNFLVGLRYSFM